MSALVIDTNVLAVADGASGHSLRCREQCARVVLQAREAATVILDNRYLILKQYRNNTDRSRQPGIGHEFFRWLSNASSRCERVEVHDHPTRIFAEFPDHPGLQNFDREDRVFIAVAAAHGTFPPILQATDSKWIDWQGALIECGLSVSLICPEDIQAAHQRKAKKKAENSRKVSKSRQC